MIGTIIVVIVVLAGVFLILREVNCWYWKINERTALQIEQNELLKKILHELLVDNKSIQKPKQTVKDGKSYSAKSDKEAKDDAENNQLSNDFELNTEEQKQVDAFMKFGIMQGERVVINKETREIDKINDLEWSKVDQREWIILFEK